MIGRTIAHYKILEKLGEGGMGVVYKAQDTKLKRTVALKFLPPELTRDPEVKERFIHEARSAAALDHPNICTIYEISEVDDKIFIAMAYLKGESLKNKIAAGPLNLVEAIGIATQIAEGLQEAHEKGVIHRDIKPTNIMITPKGQAKIMDFGVAKSAMSTTTRAGTMLGTVAYMSPEQTHGAGVDHRTDLWSLGVVLYEMITAQRPFKGDYEQAVIYSILNETPVPLRQLRADVPEELEHITDKVLAKALEDRYGSARDLVSDLRTPKRRSASERPAKDTTGAKPKPSIAVLPFANLSADPEQEYFCDGIAEEIINAVMKLENLRVVARTSAFAFKGKVADIREIGRTLGVETVLEGSVRKAGSQVRISTQLVSVSDGYHLWSERYDRDIGKLCCPEDIFSIQDEISLAIVEKLKVKLAEEERAELVKRHTHDVETYSQYLMGLYFWNKRTEDGAKKALECFQRAIEREPDYAQAHVGLAECYLVLVYHYAYPPAQGLPKGKAAVAKALEIDESLAEAHAWLAAVMFSYDWEWRAAEREFQRAIQLNPGYATAHHRHAYFLSALGRHEESIASATRAQELDPLSLIIASELGLFLYYARQFDKAIQQYEKVLEMDLTFLLAHSYLADAYLEKGMYDEALSESEQAVSLSSRGDAFVSQLAQINAAAGRRREAEEIIEELRRQSEQRSVHAYYAALIYVALGEKDAAFQWLDKALEERNMWLSMAKVDPKLDSLRSDPRFAELLRRIGLEP